MKKLQKVTLNLYDGDKEILQAFFPRLGWSPAAREILHKTAKKLQEKQQRAQGHANIDIDTSDLS